VSPAPRPRRLTCQISDPSSADRAKTWPMEAAMTVSSTNRTATGWPSQGCPAGSSVNARSQTMRPVATSSSSTDPACPTATQAVERSAVRRSAKIVILQRNEDEHQTDAADEAERRLLAVPGLRLPHLEPLAADRHQAEEPEGEAGREPDDG